MSKSDWAVYRQGIVKNNKTDYTNYTDTFDQ